MIDRIIHYSVGASASAIKNITLCGNALSEDYQEFQVIPSSLLLESAAQLGSFLVEMSYNSPEDIRRATVNQIDNAKFFRSVEPGDQLHLLAEIKELSKESAKIKVRVVTAESSIVAETNFTLTLSSIIDEQIHTQKRKLYRIWTRQLGDLPPIL
ncbi:MAG: hypothetical protein OEM02_13930 [Desulfobulbaceae bacterium]|nr:hypothetical protein [Desulfobulbaceae bacterium]